MTKEPDYFYAKLFMSAAMKSGNEGAIRLAAQLANAQPCEKCDFIWNKCRCTPKPNAKND